MDAFHLLLENPLSTRQEDTALAQQRGIYKSTRQFSELLGYLVMALVRAIHATKLSGDGELAQLHFYIAILTDKGVHDLAGPLMGKAIALAAEAEAFDTLIELLKMQRSGLRGIYDGTKQEDAFQKEHDRLLAEENLAKDKLANLWQWMDLAAEQTFLRIKEGRDLEQAIRALKASPLIRKKGMLLSKKAQLYASFVHERIASKGNLKDPCRLPFLRDQVNGFLSAPVLLQDKDFARDCIKAAFNLGIAGYWFKDNDAPLHAVRGFEVILAHKPELRDEVNERQLLLAIWKARATLTRQDCRSATKASLHALSSQSLKSHKWRLRISIRCATINIIQGRYDDAKRALNPLRNESLPDHYRQEMALVHLLYLVALLEESDFEALGREAKVSAQVIATLGLMRGFERAFLDLMKAVAKKPLASVLLFRQAQAQLLAHLSQSEFSFYQSSFVFAEYFEAKIGGESLLDRLLSQD